ncbi:MAG: DUF262 domain-containing protein, partial [Pseudomonadota bacterium]
MSKEENTTIKKIDETCTDDLGTYPIDSVLIRSETRTVFEIVRRIKQGIFQLAPDFQRDYIWTENQQSRLIESCLMRIPLPVFYLAEEQDGKIIVVDGRQRLTTFSRYLSNEFALQGLAKESSLNEKKFEDLSPKLQNRLEDTQLTLYSIDNKVPEEARLDIFERVNSGVPLTRQQMRNALYSGKATKWLKEQAQQEHFLKIVKLKESDKKEMRDREIINRFCGFYLLGVEKYPNDDSMDKFLAQSLKYMNKMNDKELTELALRFQSSMKNNYSVFGKHSFRKHTTAKERLNPFNVAIFEVFSVSLARYSEDEVLDKADKIRQAFYALMANDKFFKAISGATNSRRNMLKKFQEAEKAITEAM